MAGHLETAASARLAELAGARAAWITATGHCLAGLRFVAGAWLAGSLGRGTADAFSDIDLVVAVDDTIPPHVLADPFDGLGLPGPVLFHRPKPRNAPAGGTYLAVCVELAGLPVLVDLYLWPSSTAAVAAGGRVLVERGALPRSDLQLLALLALHPAADSTGSDPDDPASLLLLVLLAAKYHARGDRPRRAGICDQLGTPDIAVIGDLRDLLEVRLPSLRPAPPGALAAVRRLLDLISAQEEK